MRSESPVFDLHTAIREQMPGMPVHHEETRDSVPTLWVPAQEILSVLRFLRERAEPRFETLYDLTAVDQRKREHRNGGEPCSFTVVYHLYSYSARQMVRLKVALNGDHPEMTSVMSVYPNADWYEREVWDLFGIRFDGHPHLIRIIMPATWEGHPLRKDHPARATELPDFTLPDDRYRAEMDSFSFKPEDWGMERESEDTDFMFLNLGPNHPGTHGIFRVVLQLDGEEIVDAVPEIGFHHRGAEKMAERQTWHSFIPYTDRIDYLGGVMNNLAYVLSVERLAGITVPDRAKVMRIMLAELFRISSHLVWYGTFAQDLGALSPIFLMFEDRERVFDIVSAITGGRMHPSWFRIGGTALDLPNGWEPLVRDFLRDFNKHLREYGKMVMKNWIIKKRTKGVGAYDTQTAFDWGVTGPGLRATGFSWDFRRDTPYGGYDQFEFDIPTGSNGDSYDRSMVRVEELRQSARIIEQCLHNMPSGEYMSDHPLAMPPRRKKTMKDIETLINHFVGVTWGPVMPPGEAILPIEATKGSNAYYVVSDGGIRSYRTRIRTPSFPHLQMLPVISRGEFVADLIAILASIDFVMADVDR
ncbi:NADH-quinone oxidoreductase subunit C/D [Salinispira pacifica]